MRQGAAPGQHWRGVDIVVDTLLYFGGTGKPFKVMTDSCTALLMHAAAACNSSAAVRQIGLDTTLVVGERSGRLQQIT